MQTICITLVHGTYGYDSPWIVQNSNFRVRLCETLGSEQEVKFFDPFKWEQKQFLKKVLDNTVRSRILGANRFERYLLPLRYLNWSMESIIFYGSKNKVESLAQIEMGQCGA